MYDFDRPKSDRIVFRPSLILNAQLGKKRVTTERLMKSQPFCRPDLALPYRREFRSGRGPRKARALARKSLE
jgi:hypothetical protein